MVELLYVVQFIQYCVFEQYRYLVPVQLYRYGTGTNTWYHIPGYWY